MTHLIGKSGTGIEKSGTGIGKSGTGLWKSDTGIVREKSDWAIASLRNIALAGIFALSPILAFASSLQVSEHEGVVTVSLHDRGQLLAGRIALETVRSGYATVPLRTINLKVGSALQYGVNSHGSGSGQKNDNSGSGANSHGSGSGQKGDESGSGAESHGSGSGSSGNSHGSGSGSSGNSHGSGSGSSGDSHGSGSGSSGDSHGSGSGSSGDSVVGAWGIAEIAADTDGISVIVHRFSEQGTIEHLLAFGPPLTRGSISKHHNLETVAP